MKFIKKNSAGFTLLEITVSISLFAIIIILTGDIYLVTQRAYRKNSDLAELTQNARVSLDRLSRELRQAAEIITTLPPGENDPLNPPADLIFFQDGHNSENITYLRYYLDGASLMRQHEAYHFEGYPDNYVSYNSLDQGGSSPEINILETRLVGEYFTEIKFWETDGSVNISLSLEKNQNNFTQKTAIFSRNR